MSERQDEMKKLTAIATDMGLAAELRIKAIDLLGRNTTREALLVLLDLGANEQLYREERELALKHAIEIVKAGS